MYSLSDNIHLIERKESFIKDINWINLPAAQRVCLYIIFLSKAFKWDKIICLIWRKFLIKKLVNKWPRNRDFASKGYLRDCGCQIWCILYDFISSRFLKKYEETKKWINTLRDRQHSTQTTNHNSIICFVDLSIPFSFYNVLILCSHWKKTTTYRLFTLKKMVKTTKNIRRNLT